MVGVLATAREGRAQGCVPSRGAGPLLGSQASPYLDQDHWQFDFGWRYFVSDRHYTGTSEDKDRQRGNSQVKNTIHQFNFGLTYGWDDQTSIAFGVPYMMNERSVPNVARVNGEIEKIEPNFRNNTSARGIGDASVIARRWLLDVHDNLDQNIGIGFGLKLPTGESNVHDTVLVRSDPKGTPNDFTDDVYNTQSRPVDQSIQPGDGGWGFILDLTAFKTIGLFTPYITGSYLFNVQEVSTTRNTAGVNVPASNGSNPVFSNDRGFMSIVDQYLLRIGTMVTIPSMEGFALGIGGRMEGVPVRDVYGGSGGFRRPGFTIAIEPQVVYAYEREVFSFSLPWVVVRNRHRSVSDQFAGSGTHGDSAFADYLLLFNWSHRF